MAEAPYLSTKRLILRPLRYDDSKNLAYLLCPEIQKDSGPFMPHSFNDLPKHIERIKGDTSWLITINQDKVIGDMGVFSTQGNETGEMAWYLDPKYWRMGFGTEAGSAIIDYMFFTLGFRKLTAPIDSKNIPSRRLAEKLGFNLEYIEHASNLYGKKSDVCSYSISNVTN
jgi:RimJ/RimL family protein N-acetyltransferase